MNSIDDINNLPDDELIKRIKKGDEKCFEVLSNRYYPGVYTVVLSKIMDEDLAKDIIQEVFVKVWEGLGKYKEKGSFRSWLYSITKNHITDYVRKNRSRKKYEIYTEESYPLDCQADSKNLLSALNQKEIGKYILKALKRLPDEQQEVFLMYYYFNIPVDDIAKKLKIPVGTVTSRLHLARMKLREILKNWGIEP
ncbi:MAG: sigma-70 family RNA polymerase sigma factor [Candidatus Hydrogenedentes bacterium]|nr:sigma-70 family RNA polymerase sigma factor [Candidatus Hydrogenedentota bacterium]